MKKDSAIYRQNVSPCLLLAPAAPLFQEHPSDPKHKPGETKARRSSARTQTQLNHVVPNLIPHKHTLTLRPGLPGGPGSPEGPGGP